jgi:hypothetical protein
MSKLHVFVSAALPASRLHVGHSSGGASDAQNRGGQAPPMLVPVERVPVGPGVLHDVGDGRQYDVHRRPEDVRITLIDTWSPN